MRSVTMKDDAGKGNRDRYCFIQEGQRKKAPDKVSKEYEKMVRFSGKEPRQREQQF